MLYVLFGNKNVQKILLFLFVNGKCYGTQLHHLLKTPLTPIQKALNRLEKGGLIISYYEGKTRLYQFNLTYPLLQEVEQLLKKAYMLLPTAEKKQFYVGKSDSFKLGFQENKVAVLINFWERLHQVKRLSFHAKSKSKEEMGWNGKGKGEVLITKENSTIMIFQEKGIWQNKQGNQISFSNVFRWTLDRFEGIISLEHLRHGANLPVFLFHLAPSGKHTLSSVDSHLCGGDMYFGQIHFDPNGFCLNWRVIGPKKNEEIDYYYT